MHLGVDRNNMLLIIIDKGNGMLPRSEVQLLIIAELLVAGGHSAGLWSFVWTDQINTWILAVANAVLLH